MQYFATVKQAMILGLMLIGIIVGLQVSYLLRQTANTLDHADELVVANGVQTALVLQTAEAALLSIRNTTEVVRKSSETQVGYYEAIGRRTSNAMAQIEITVRNTDDRLERITQAMEQASGGMLDISDQTSQQIYNIGKEATATLKDVHKSVDELNALIADPSVKRSMENVEVSTELTAEAISHVEESTAAIRDMLKPTKKSFWRNVFERLIPRPTFGF